MKKTPVVVAALMAVVVIGGIILFAKAIDSIQIGKRPGINAENNSPAKEAEVLYSVFSGTDYINGFTSLDDAIKEAQNHKDAVVKEKGKAYAVWDNLPPYQVFLSENSYHDFNTFEEAMAFAKDKEKALIYYRKNNTLIWDTLSVPLKEYRIKDVPLNLQNPELPRGCEVTALSMLLNYNGFEVSKMELAEKIEKDPAAYRIVGNKIHFGNPHKGFVGSMTNMSEQGLGVYNEPIFELCRQYAEDRAVNITGSDFMSIQYFIMKDMPVWVIINAAYEKLPESAFETWATDYGDVRVTYREHSVLITGYDEKYIYFNDPLGAKSYADYSKFVEAWEQMGSQAVTITN